MKIKITLLACLMGISSIANSGQATGHIAAIMTGPQPDYDGRIFIKMKNPPQRDPDTCHNNNHYDFVFDASTEGGKVSLSVLLSANAAGKSVSIGGSNTCSIYNGIESVDWIFIPN